MGPIGGKCRSGDRSARVISPTTMTKYATILLDLGGVLIDVDYNASANAFRDLG